MGTKMERFCAFQETFGAILETFCVLHVIKFFESLNILCISRNFLYILQNILCISTNNLWVSGKILCIQITHCAFQETFFVLLKKDFVYFWRHFVDLLEKYFVHYGKDFVYFRKRFVYFGERILHLSATVFHKWYRTTIPEYFLNDLPTSILKFTQKTIWYWNQWFPENNFMKAWRVVRTLWTSKIGSFITKVYGF